MGVSGGWSKVGAELQSGGQLQRQMSGTWTRPNNGPLDKGQVQMGRHNGRAMIQVGRSRVRFAKAAVIVQFSDAHTERPDDGLVVTTELGVCTFVGFRWRSYPSSLVWCVFISQAQFPWYDFLIHPAAYTVPGHPYQFTEWRMLSLQP